MGAHATLRFLRINTWPAGVRYHVLWNGLIDAATGDGKPNANPNAAVDAVNPLTPQPIEIWPVGKAGYGAEPHGSGLHGMVANWHAGYGHGREVRGVGEHGLYNDYVTWSTSLVLPTLRNGQYKFAVRLEDACGTIQQSAIVEKTIVIDGVPRPPSGLRMVSFANGQLSLAWNHSPDLVDLAV